MKKRALVVWIFVIVTMTLLAGCGGGGGGGGSDNAGDTIAPTVSSTSPANGSADVAMNSSIAATFSEGMDSSTINGTTFTLSGGSGSVSGTVTCNGSTATFTPSSNLSYSTTYTATITTGAKDAAGNAVASNYTWNFTTGNASDTTPPTVSSTSPANNASGVAVNSAITATFSETMDASSINAATFYIGGVSGTVTYNGTTATFTPSSNMNYDTAYTVTVTTGAKDAAGNAVAANYTWSFTTGNAADTTAPTNTTASNFINSGASSTSSTSVTLAISATDAVGVTAYFASESSTAPSASASGWTAVTSATSYSASLSYTLSSGGGTKTVYVWFKDSAENVSASASDSISLTVQKSWGTPQLLETNTGLADYPQIAIDSSGNAIAVWTQSDGSYISIYANRYTAGTGWGTAQLIENNTGHAGNLQIAFDPSGNAIAVWGQNVGTYDSIYTNRYTAGAGWGTAQVISSGVSASWPKIAIDPSGNAIAVWDQWDGTYLDIYANRFTAGVGWGTAQLIESNTGNANSDCPPGVAIDSSGNAIAVWSQFNGTYSSIYANRYTTGAGWGTAQLIENNTYNAGNTEVAIDSSGNAIAVWDQWDGTVRNIYTNRYTTASGWGSAQLLETNTGGAVYPQIAIDSSGNASSVWHQSDGTYLSIYANRYTAGSGWGTAQLIENNTGNARSSERSRVAIDSSGNAIAVWSQSDGIYFRIYANHYTAGAGWGTAQVIESINTAAVNPQIAFDSSGNAIAVWRQVDASGDGDIYANRYE